MKGRAEPYDFVPIFDDVAGGVDRIHNERCFVDNPLVINIFVAGDDDGTIGLGQDF